MITILSYGCDWDVREIACRRCKSVLAYEKGDVRDLASCLHRGPRYSIICPVCRDDAAVPDPLLPEPLLVRWRGAWRERARRRAVRRIAQRAPAMLAGRKTS